MFALGSSFSGAGFWAAAEAALGRPIVMLCGADAGAVLASLRAGSRSIGHDVLPPQRAALDALIAAHGGETVVARPDVRLRGLQPASPQLARWRFEGGDRSGFAC
ncbi:MAG: hypothetical protein AAFX81_06170 [Pseudomonadota bacterium]